MYVSVLRILLWIEKKIIHGAQTHEHDGYVSN